MNQSYWYSYYGEVHDANNVPFFIFTISIEKSSLPNPSQTQLEISFFAEEIGTSLANEISNRHTSEPFVFMQRDRDTTHDHIMVKVAPGIAAPVAIKLLADRLISGERLRT